MGYFVHPYFASPYFGQSGGVRVFFITTPLDMKFEDWANATIMGIDQSITGPVVHPSEDDWQGWANAMFPASTKFPFNLPSPDRFDDWRDWANALILALQAPAT